MSFEEEKRRVAQKALELIQPGMKVGIGTGSTIFFFIEELKKIVKTRKLDLSFVATSKRSHELLGNILPSLSQSLIDELDITFDGADRIDLNTFYLIKGGGGALLREKLVALSSKRNVILVDQSKVTSPLQGFPLALEIVPFGFEATIKRLKQAGYEGSLRLNAKKPILSDNENFLFDIYFKGPLINPPEHHEKLKSLHGVIETGLFLDTTTDVLIGNADGNVTHLVNKSHSQYS